MQRLSGGVAFASLTQVRRVAGAVSMHLRHHRSVMPQPAEFDSPAPDARQRWRGRLAALRGPIVIIAGIGTVLGGLAGYVTMYRTVTTTAPAAPAAAPAAAEAPLSLAVLPLANHTGDPARAYLADGLTAAITADLGRLSQLLLVPPQAAAGLAKKGLTMAQLGAEAHVRFVLEGAVAASGEQLRIATTLTDTASGRQVWAETFEGRASELFALQDQVTSRIRASVAPNMVLTALPEAERRRQEPKAADLMLRAQALNLQQRTLANQKQLVGLWQQAHALDPESRVAMVGLASSTLILVQSFAYDLRMTQADRIAALEAMAPLARKVLADNPASAEMNNVLADLALYRGDAETARRLMQEVQQRDPRSWAAMNNLAFLLTRIGEPEAAYEWGMKALQIPTWRPPQATFSNLRQACMMMGRFEEAVKWARRTVELNPDRPSQHAFLAIALAMAGDEAGARAATAEALKRDPSFTWVISTRPWPGKESAFQKYSDEVIRIGALRAGLPTRERAED